ncbi:hypothetical protein FD13_GL000283 [Levilactobacillus senmaizukei DSM 21775 = NBRC 103853]|uniref:Uncharacterized protein n=1 Tax=Levilactobacillus senmaizukei DSM 21775 = NBRC 103853 TaxID=1423803 RepID=A0A0R2DDN8_9LACO|nr:hypothetical protein [Levilactobacillus senmaizukei]KRN02143.1 hypothetical protein FD13_GL000283 [Levilactobacillus senmaizukei DSM 21775 = NBRC 103853]
MTKIKVIGDILSGKYQPTLTGNPTVDAALVDRFCQKLAIALHLDRTMVQAEHHWNLQLNPEWIYLVDSKILQDSDRIIPAHNVVGINHTDLLRGQTKTTEQKLTKFLTTQPSLK